MSETVELWDDIYTFEASHSTDKKEFCRICGEFLVEDAPSLIFKSFYLFVFFSSFSNFFSPPKKQNKNNNNNNKRFSQPSRRHFRRNKKDFSRRKKGGRGPRGGFL